MTSHTHHETGEAPKQSFWRSRNGLVFIAFAIIGAAYLLFEHAAHVVQYLPYGILLLCPLMHVFMHRGHSGHRAHSGESQTSKSRDRS